MSSIQEDSLLLQRNDSTFFRCLSPCVSRLSPRVLHSVPSSAPFFDVTDGVSFGADSPVHLKSSTSLSTTFNAREKRQCCDLSPTLNDSYHDNLNIKIFGDELESETVESSLFYPNHNFASSSLFERPREPRNPLSFCSPSGVQLMPYIPDAESFVGIDYDSDDMLPEQDQSFAEDIVLHFKKTVSRKRIKLAVFTETLFDIRCHEKSNVNTGLLRPKEELEQLLALTEQHICDNFIPTAPSASGRSRISKIQHEILNSWFYSHLDNPYVSLFNLSQTSHAIL
jgi:hypothetical protein